MSVRSIVTLLLLALWLPASLHCALEKAGFVTHGGILTQIGAANEKSLPDCDEHDGGKVLERQLVIEKSETALPALKIFNVFLSVAVPRSFAVEQLREIVRLRLGDAPPARLADLYFVLRAAPLARAPSLV